MSNNDPNAIPIVERQSDAQILVRLDREIKQAEQWHDWTRRRLTSLQHLREAFAARLQPQ